MKPELRIKTRDGERDVIVEATDVIDCQDKVKRRKREGALN